MYLGARCGFRISNAFLMLEKQTLGVLGASESSSLHSEVRRAWCARCQPLFGLGKAGVTPPPSMIPTVGRPGTDISDIGTGM